MIMLVLIALSNYDANCISTHLQTPKDLYPYASLRLLAPVHLFKATQLSSCGRPLQSTVALQHHLSKLGAYVLYFLDIWPFSRSFVSAQLLSENVVSKLMA